MEDIIRFIAGMDSSTTLYGVNIVISFCIILIVLAVAIVWKPFWTGKSD